MLASSDECSATPFLELLLLLNVAAVSLPSDEITTPLSDCVRFASVAGLLLRSGPGISRSPHGRTADTMDAAQEKLDRLRTLSGTACPRFRQVVRGAAQLAQLPRAGPKVADCRQRSKSLQRWQNDSP